MPRTDQDHAREVDGKRLAPPTTPDRNAIAEDRAAVDKSHTADRPPTDDEAEAAERNELDPDVAESYKDANERGAAQKGEGKPGL
jgi:hypothetical protein